MQTGCLMGCELLGLSQLGQPLVGITKPGGTPILEEEEMKRGEERK